MNPMQPLLALLSQSERERDFARFEAHRAAEAHRRARAQAEQLRSYRSDHEARFGAQFAGEGGAAIDIVQCYQGFVGSLGEAIEQQERIVAGAAQGSARADAALRTLELRVASVKKLIERRSAEARLSADRRGQKAQDEFASRAAWNRLAAAGAVAPGGAAG